MRFFHTNKIIRHKAYCVKKASIFWKHETIRHLIFWRPKVNIFHGTKNHSILGTHFIFYSIRWTNWVCYFRKKSNFKIPFIYARQDNKYLCIINLLISLKLNNESVDSHFTIATNVTTKVLHYTIECPANYKQKQKLVTYTLYFPSWKYTVANVSKWMQMDHICIRDFFVEIGHCWKQELVI